MATLGDLQDALFAQIDRLAEAQSDEAVAMGVSRASAVKGIAETVIANAKTAMDAVRLGSELYGAKVATVDPALRLTNGDAKKNG